MSDVGSRTPKQSLLQRKASHQGSDGQTPDDRNYEGYYGEDGWWEEDGYHHFGSYDASYYEEWHGEGRADDIFEVDLYSMVFVLDENLAPKDMYNGFEFEEKTFLFSIEAEDVTPSTPAAWKSRPLKIHPEPPPYRKDMASTPPPRSGAATDANTGGSNTPTAPGGRTPRQKAAIPPKMDTPKDVTLPALATTPPRRPVEPPSKEDSEQSGDELAGKIHINNKQLEHLKQKMQALKQRRASLPEKEKDDKDGKEKDKEKKEEKKDKEKVEKEKDKENHKKDESHTNGPKRTEGTVHSNCPGAHGLSLFKTPARGWWCSVCEKEHDKGSAFYGCRTCDYDECEACAMTPRPKAAPQAPQVPEKQPDKPSAPVEASRTNNSNSTPVKARGTTKNSTPPPKKKVSSSSSSSSSSGDSKSSKSRSPSSPSKKSPPKKETKKDKGDSKKKANSKEKNVKKGDAKRDAQDKGDKGGKGDKGDKGDKRKAAKVKVKKTVKRPCKAKSKSRSDDKSDDKAKKKSKNTRKTKRAASDPKLVPRKKDSKEAKEESLEPKRRKEKEVSPKKAARSRSRDGDSSQSEEPPKKRAANALTVAAERAPVSLTRASAARREEEKPPADEGTRARRNAPAAPAEAAEARRSRGAGGDLLRRVLRANAVHNARQDGGPTRSKEGEPRATLVPPTRKDESSSEESVPRGAATLRPPQDRGIKKAAEARKSRRV